MNTAAQQGPMRELPAGLILLIWVLAIASTCSLVLFQSKSLKLQHWDAGAYTAGPLETGPYAREVLVPFYAPPLFPAIVGEAFKRFGTEDWVATACSGVFSILSVIVLGLLATRLFGPSIGALATLFLGVTEFHIAYGRMALTDSPFLFFFLAALLVFQRAVSTHHRFLFVAGGIISGLALLTKYHGFLPFAMAGLYMVLAATLSTLRFGVKAGLESFGEVVRNTLWTCLGFLPFVAYLVWHIDSTVTLEAYADNRSQWVPTLGLSIFHASALYMKDVLLHWVSPAILGLAGIGVAISIFGRLRSHPFGVGYFLCWMIPFTLAVAFYKNYPRLILPLIPGLAILAAWGAFTVSGIFRKPGPRAACLLLISLLAAAHGVYASIETVKVSPNGYEKASQKLREESGPQKTTLAISQHNLFFYLRDVPGIFLSHNEELGHACLLARGFDFLLVDLRRARHREEWKQDFLEYFESEDFKNLELIAEISNPLFEMTLVNSHGNFEILDILRDAPHSEIAQHSTIIRIYKRRTE